MPSLLSEIKEFLQDRRPTGGRRIVLQKIEISATTKYGIFQELQELSRSSSSGQDFPFYRKDAFVSLLQRGITNQST